MISVFISSTFKDMQAERDILHTMVFPQIRKRLEAYGESLQELDLRWGVDTSLLSEEESSRAVINTCIDGINRCRPYMLVLLGNRYGWIPDENSFDTVSDNRIKKYAGETMSITQMEIEYGALDASEIENCLFCFRNQDLPSAIPSQIRDFYDSESEFHREKLESLKRKIVSSEGAQIMEYDAGWNDEVGVELGDFGDRITEELWSMIVRNLPEIPHHTDSIPEHTVFADAVARRKQYMQTYVCRKEDNNPMANGGWYVGRPGTGKSAMLARAATNFIRIGVQPFLFFCENRGCNNINMLLSSLLCYLDQIEGKPARSYLEESRQSKLGQIVERLKSMEKDFAILIDAVDRTDADVLDILNVLYRAIEKLDRKKQFASIIISSTDQYYEENQNQIESMTTVLQISDFNQLEVNAFVERHTALRAKTLDEAVLSAIREKKESRVPYYLSLMLQRLFMMDQDDFEQAEKLASGMAGISGYMCSLIRSMPEETDELVLVLLDETYAKMSRHSGALQSAAGNLELASPADIMNLLAASVNGLKLSDISEIMKKSGKLVLPALMEQIFTYLYDSFEQTGDGVWNFRHRLMRESIRRTMPAGVYEGLCNALLDYYESSEAADPNELLSYAAACSDTTAAAHIMKKWDALNAFIDLLRTAEGRAFISKIYQNTDRFGRTRILFLYVLSENIPLTDPAIGEDYLRTLCETSDDLSIDGRYLLELMKKKFAYFGMGSQTLEKSQRTANELHDMVSANVRENSDVAEIFKLREAKANDYPELFDEANLTNDFRAHIALAEASGEFLDILKDDVAVEQAQKQIDTLERLNRSFPTNRGSYLLAKLHQVIADRKAGTEKGEQHVKKAITYIDRLVSALSDDNITTAVDSLQVGLYIANAGCAMNHLGRWQNEHRDEADSAIEEAVRLAEASLQKNYRKADAVYCRDAYHYAAKYYYYIDSAALFEKYASADLKYQKILEDSLDDAESRMSFVEHRIELAEMLFARGYSEASGKCAGIANELWKKLSEDPDRSALDQIELSRLDVRRDLIYVMHGIREKEYQKALDLCSEAYSKLSSYVREQGGIYPRDTILMGYLLSKLSIAQQRAGLNGKELVTLEYYYKNHCNEILRYCSFGEDYRAGIRLIADRLVRLADIYREKENQESTAVYRLAQNLYLELAEYMPDRNISCESQLLSGFRHCIVAGINHGHKIDPAMYDLYMKGLHRVSLNRELDQTETVIFKKGLPLSTDAVIWRDEDFLDKAQQIVAGDAVLVTAIQFARAVLHLCEDRWEQAKSEIDDLIRTRSHSNGEEWLQQIILLLKNDEAYSHKLAMSAYDIWCIPYVRSMAKLPAPVYDMADMYYKGYYATRMAGSKIKHKYAKDYLRLLKKVVEQEKDRLTNSTEAQYENALNQKQFGDVIGADFGDMIPSYGGLTDSWYAKSEFRWLNFKVASQLITAFNDKEYEFSKEEYLEMMDDFSSLSWYFIETKTMISETGNLAKSAFRVESYRGYDWLKQAGDATRGAHAFFSILYRYMDRIDPADFGMFKRMYDMYLYLTDCIRSDGVRDEMSYLKIMPGILAKIIMGAYAIKHDVSFIHDYIEQSDMIRERIKTHDDSGNALKNQILADREVLMSYLESERDTAMAEKYLEIIDSAIKDGYLDSYFEELSAVINDLYRIRQDYPEMRRHVSETIAEVVRIQREADDFVMYVMYYGLRHDPETGSNLFNPNEWYPKKRKELEERYGHLV